MLKQKLNPKSKKFLLLYKFLHIIIVSIVIIIYSSCGYQQPLNLTIAKERVEKYYECGQYEQDLQRIINRAISHFRKISANKKATVIFDIDDTVLSDYVDAKSISFGYVPKLSHEWVLRTDAPAIQQTKRLYDYLVIRNFIIIFLTGRKHNEYDATMKNLKKQGFIKFEKLIVRQKDEEHLTAENFKTTHRQKLSKEGYRIVGCVGDQWSDLNGGSSGYTVKLPNVRYFIP
ncbi:MAG: HAD family acid phosphatase [bacterium]